MSMIDRDWSNKQTCQTRQHELARTYRKVAIGESIYPDACNVIKQAHKSESPIIKAVKYFYNLLKLKELK